jgi:GGDEF domain-containing protein
MSWLCPNPGDRERLLDMEQRLAGVRTAAFGVLTLAVLISAPWMGWWLLLPVVACAAAFTLASRGMATGARPEYRIAFVWACSQVTIAACAWLTGGAESPGLSWLVVPVITLPVRFGTRGVAAGVGFTIALLLLVTFGLDLRSTVDGPEHFLFPLAAIVAVALLSTALLRSDLEHRSEAVVDPLTGMLNRNALMTRVVELAQQSAITREPVSLIVGDLDRFKQINDGHGHAAGDAVLKDVAYVIRKQLRAYDLVYRLGGEEFLVVLPGGPAGARRGRRRRAARGDRADAGRRPARDDVVRHRGLRAGGVRLRVGVRRGRSRALRGQARRAQPRRHARVRPTRGLAVR